MSVLPCTSKCLEHEINFKAKYNENLKEKEGSENSKHKESPIKHLISARMKLYFIS